MKLGQTVMTRGIASEIERNSEFAKEITQAFSKYLKCDWGDLCADDKQLNDEALKNNDDRILAAYNTSEGKVYIITEWDRSVTTILFADEY